MHIKTQSRLPPVIMKLTCIFAAIAAMIPAVEGAFGIQTTPSASSDARAAGNPNAFDRLATAPSLLSVQTGEPLLLTDQWRNSELLPFRNQRCVVEFLRHFG